MEGGAGFGAGVEIVYEGGGGIYELTEALGIGWVRESEVGGDHVEELGEGFVGIGDRLVIWVDLST